MMKADIFFIRLFLNDPMKSAKNGGKDDPWPVSSHQYYGFEIISEYKGSEFKYSMFAFEKSILQAW